LAFSLVLPASGLPLPFCLLVSIAVFGFGAGDGFCLSPDAVAPTLAEFALLLASCFPTLSSEIFVGAGNGFGRPAAAVPEPVSADSALPLPSCFLTSIAGLLGFTTGNTMGPLAAVALALV